MTVLKRDRKSSATDLVQALRKLTLLLANQDEAEAVVCLNNAATALEAASSGSPAEKAAVSQIIDAFEDEHELMAYTLQREGNQWTEAEELSQASTRVLNLARRLK